MPHKLTWHYEVGLDKNKDRNEVIVLLGKNYHDHEVFFTTKATKRTKKSTGVAFVFFVPFVVQFWLRLTPRYETCTDE